ncbi:magnesium transport protein CorA [mine drainage metagenome]|uniref:Magnesium transport protein CorA n=1 Tax=mine drainage metagenome TaxID=410659 RepID=A0A1J5QRM5_9ZZZZ
MPPGSLIHIGEVRTRHTEVSLFRYDTGQLAEHSAQALEGLDLQVPETGTLWVNVYGLHDAGLMADIGRAFNLHPLTLEDILNTHQRPKLDSFDHYLFFVTRFFSFDPEAMSISSEQVSIVLGHNFVLTFQERPTGSFEPVRERLRADKGHVRKAGADYLAYALLDVIVDRYFIVLEQIGDDCEALEEELLKKPTSSVLQNIHKLKHETMELRRAVWPLREVVNALTRNEDGYFQPGTVLYLRDVYDHTVHFIESLESLRDLLAGMLDIYLSSISNRVNMEVRALTVVAMLFMPATLIAGIFGMNFRAMPLLQNPDGFWIAMGMMAFIAAVMGLIIWHRQWLSRRS